MKIGIIGLGLIGGSFAKSTKELTCHTVAAVDIDAETMTLARLCGAIDEPLTSTAIGGCDLILLALQPQAAIDWVKKNAKEIREDAIVVDLCGVKRCICREIAPIAAKHGFSFIGGHPMAGKERSGFVNATPDLFYGASMILTPDSSTKPAALETLKTYFTDIGFANITYTTPEEHDRIIAYTSQLAHITSSAYIKSATAGQRRGFSAGSFKDMTRVARLDEDMWTELLFDNDDHLLKELEFFIEQLKDFEEALRTKDRQTLHRLLKEGREKKAEAGGN